MAAGDTLGGRYAVTGIAGQGGMGTIFQALDQYLVDSVDGAPHLAVKVLHTEVTQRPELLRELLAEFLHLRSLSHPNIVRVHEFHRDGALAFFTMELLDGSTLGRVISAAREESLDREHARSIIHETGMAVAHAHARGIVHGDLNPQNIFLTQNGELRVLDFGLSRRLEDARTSVEPASVPSVPMATLRFASCEVLEGQRADRSDDLFALACVAYVLLSGQHPFANQTAVQARGVAMRPRRPRGLDARRWKALREGLEFRRDRRPADVDTWVRRVNGAAALRPLPMLSELAAVRPSRRGTARAAVLAAALACLASGGLWIAHERGLLQAVVASVRAAVSPRRPN